MASLARWSASAIISMAVILSAASVKRNATRTCPPCAHTIPAAPSTLTSENVAIQVRVLLDGVPVPIAPPSLLSNITFDNLIRTTTRFTAGQIDFLTLVVDEGGARSFTWIARDVGNGTHAVAVQARFLFNNVRFPLATTFSSIAAVLGPKTLTVEQVKLKD